MKGSVVKDIHGGINEILRSFVQFPSNVDVNEYMACPQKFTEWLWASWKINPVTAVPYLQA
jgi:hypothetical protein